MRSGGSTHLSASITAATDVHKQPQLGATCSRISAATAAALSIGRSADYGAADRKLAQIDASAADATGYLLHPAVGDNCIHIAAVPGKGSLTISRT